ncbi:hypothetical protein NDU88_008373 [Pleurodeles waltl]|uniref:Uncharacterized protein n=1 Tax=Pleurodeles waltl TaxID=8319 RepID=A0AAV7NE23_PLEWA|nr:hypothetical protein NDU88_008373 [Pleurodeles waltl]
MKPRGRMLARLKRLEKPQRTKRCLSRSCARYAPLAVTGRHRTTRPGESLPRGIQRMECKGVPHTRHTQKGMR